MLLAQLVPQILECVRRVELAPGAKEIDHLAVHKGRGVCATTAPIAQRGTDHALEALAVGRSVGADRRERGVGVEEHEAQVAQRALGLAAEGREGDENRVAMRDRGDGKRGVSDGEAGGEVASDGARILHLVLAELDDVARVAGRRDPAGQSPEVVVEAASHVGSLGLSRSTIPAPRRVSGDGGRFFPRPNAPVWRE